MATTVAFSDLDNWLQSQPANTASTPYEINITGITSADLSVSGTTCPFRNVIYNNLTKYLDLRETILPNVTNLDYTFKGCTNLVYAPSIPESVNYMGVTFYGCTSLKEAPAIPSSIYSMGSTFYGCTSLTETPVFSEIINNSNVNRYLTMQNTFQGCTSLVAYGSAFPKRISNFYQTFYNCTSLTETPSFSGQSSQYQMEANQTFGYCTSLVTINEFPNDAKLAGTFIGCTALTDLSEVEINQSVVNNLFQYCTNLTKPPVFSGAVTSLAYSFDGCTSLTEVPSIPSTVTELVYAFRDCTGITSWKIKEWNLSITGSQHCFKNCSNLVNFYTDTPYELKNWLSSAYTDLPTSISNCNFYEYSETAENTITVLNNELSAWSENTASAPLKIKVTGLTSSNVESSAISGTLGYILNQNSTKYVDLSETELPSVTSLLGTFAECENLTASPEIPATVTTLASTFTDCTSLADAPEIPSSVTTMSASFYGCSSLEEAPVIPNGVTNLSSAFLDCTSLVTVPNVPATVTNLTSTFDGCSSLETIEEFDVPLSVLKTNAEDCFSGCTSLTSIGVQGADPITEASEWHAIRLNFGADNVSGKVYDKDKNTTTIPQTTIQKGTLKLPIKTDELWFPPSNLSDTDVDEVIESVIDTKRTYFNKNVLNPLNKSFVLWKDSQSQFVSNIDFGGGGGGSGITVYPTQEELEEDLPNLQDGDIVGTYGDDNTNYNDAPLGSVMSYLGTTDPSDGKWLICDGRDTTGTAIELETHYPSLYMFLGGTNVLPEIFDHSRPSAIENVNGDSGFTLTTTNSVAPYDGIITFGYSSSHYRTLYVNNVARSMSGNSGGINTSSYEIKKGDLVRVDIALQLNDTINNVIWFKKHKIIKAVSSVDTYNIPSSEIAQVEQYFDNGLQNAEGYSTTETLTGGKWIDGKPIYRRVLDNGSWVSNLSIDVSSFNIDTLIHLDILGRQYSNNTGSKWVISTMDYRQAYISGSNILTTSGDEYKRYAIIEYTKTTD